MRNFEQVQQYMQRERIDSWLVYDFRGNNPIFAQLIPGRRNTTRRVVLHIPARGEPTLLVHGLDAGQFSSLAINKQNYLGWRDLHAWLQTSLAGRVAMEYAPGATLPVVSIVDAGTVELVRSVGVEVVSSANLIQVSVATWSAEAVERHMVASRKVNQIKDDAFAFIGERIRAAGRAAEIEVQQFMHRRFEGENLEWPDGPIVGVNAHSGDPHYEPTAATSANIQRGDWILIDLWARQPGEENIFSDITWVGFAGEKPSDKHVRVFDAVKAARDASVHAAQKAWADKRSIQGWQLDDAAREQIIAVGFGEFIKHRTGHSLSPGPKVHGLGMNLDNTETHDTREMLPGIGYTIEPGIYLPEFGVRLEINMFVDPQRGPIVTSQVQSEIIRVAV
ncbi:MAG: M24 family metallopeptidase [Phycisphaerae bacterium]